jgi:Na+/melibiose symporter-like transporter
LGIIFASIVVTGMAISLMSVEDRKKKKKEKQEQRSVLKSIVGFFRPFKKLSFAMFLLSTFTQGCGDTVNQTFLQYYLHDVIKNFQFFSWFSLSNAKAATRYNWKRERRKREYS